jgi:four helix bundle protein
MNEAYQEGFRSLVAWKEAHALTLNIYKMTRSFPADEKHAITSQLRRAASSIAAQLAEGSRMSSQKHRHIFYERAYASAAEVDYFLELSKDLGYCDSITYENGRSLVNRASYLIKKLSASCKASS